MENEIEVAPSAEFGNIPVDAPSEQPSVETPPAEEPVVPPAPLAEPEASLYELPDGRKVDAETLTKVWKEDFLPEFTRKSQALSEYEKLNSNNKVEVKAYQKPDYEPQSYEEIIRIAKEEAIAEINHTQQQKVESERALESAVETQLVEVKKLDPTLNENQLFQHAVKYKFQDLGLAYQNMKDMQGMVKAVQNETVKNLQKRAAEPIGVPNGSTGITNPSPSNFSSAIDYYRSLKN